MRNLLLVALLALLPTVAAQPISVDDLDRLFGTEPQVEVNLRGSLLRLAAAAAQEDSPEAALMLDGLRAVTVRIYPTAETGLDRAIQSLSQLANQFESDGWFTLVRVRSLPDSDNDEGDVWVYVREDGDAFDGMAVMAMDREEGTAVFVHIDGTIDPTQVSALSRRFARVDLDDEDEDDDE